MGDILYIAACNAFSYSNQACCYILSDTLIQKINHQYKPVHVPIMLENLLIILSGISQNPYLLFLTTPPIIPNYPA